MLQWLKDLFTDREDELHLLTIELDRMIALSETLLQQGKHDLAQVLADSEFFKRGENQ